MRTKKAIWYVIVVAVVVCIFATGIFFGYIAAVRMMARKEFSVDQIVPRDITADLTMMKDWRENANQPKDVRTSVYFEKAIQSATQAWHECQELVNSRQVKTRYWNGLYSATWESDDGKETIFLAFSSEKGKIRQADKRVFVDQNRKTQIKEKGYHLRFYDSGNLKLYSRGDGIQEVWFRPGNKIESFFHKEPDGTMYTSRWDKEGKLISERVHRKTAKPTSQSDKTQGKADLNQPSVERPKHTGPT